MRSLFALALLTVVVASEFPISSIIGWLKEHRAEVFETAEECKDVPAIIMKAKANKDCYAEKSTEDKAAIALWYAITGLEHMNGPIGEWVKHSPMMDEFKDFATTKVIAVTHEGADKFCGNDNCTDQVKEVQLTIASCYASFACTFMDKIVPFGTCKIAIDKYMETTMQIASGSMCKSDDIEGKTHYCAEMNSNLMFGDFDCFMEIKKAASPGATCTSKCMKEWNATKTKMPKCTKIVSDMSQVIYNNLKLMLGDMAKDAKIDMQKIIDQMPSHLPTYDETCGDHKPPQWLLNSKFVMV